MIQASDEIHEEYHHRLFNLSFYFNFIHIYGLGIRITKMCDGNRNALDFRLWEEIPLREDGCCNLYVGYIAILILKQVEAKVTIQTIIL